MHPRINRFAYNSTLFMFSTEDPTRAGVGGTWTSTLPVSAKWLRDEIVTHYCLVYAQPVQRENSIS